MFTRYFIKLSFKGTNYKGWQIQSRGITIQGILTNALCLILKEDIVLTGAGRTDSGVHALNYYAHFDSVNCDPDNIDDLKRKLNSFLPPDIFVHDIFRVSNSLHARFDAVSRTYHYVVTLNENPFLQEFSHHYYGKIDMDPMNEACLIILKHTDFTSFGKLHGNNKTNLCKIIDAEWREVSHGVLVFRITADRFLRGMVRAITGCMLSIGSGKIPHSRIETIFSEMNRSAAGMSAPACGLFLTNISYNKKEIKQGSIDSLSPILPVSGLFF